MRVRRLRRTLRLPIFGKQMKFLTAYNMVCAQQTLMIPIVASGEVKGQELKQPSSGESGVRSIIGHWLTPRKQRLR